MDYNKKTLLRNMLVMTAAQRGARRAGVLQVYKLVGATVVFCKCHSRIEPRFEQFETKADAVASVREVREVNKHLRRKEVSSTCKDCGHTVRVVNVVTEPLKAQSAAFRRSQAEKVTQAVVNLLDAP